MHEVESEKGRANRPKLLLTVMLRTDGFFRYLRLLGWLPTTLLYSTAGVSLSTPSPLIIASIRSFPANTHIIALFPHCKLFLC